ncbi:hypothetical protein CEP54_014003 [Fusarium duplospermum]|uniref:Cytochrome P450 n=1 Tax=Fusarium duplospermum TaxID=1325734 RepID=A0A428NZF1_9HYPO|nr:hypothetical protein CEP54_014003 [Fusarium duplospermum]
MDQEFKVAVITLAVIGAMLAGVLNTTITAAWNLCYLAQNPLWQSKLRAEVDQVILKYRHSPDEGVAEVLQRLELKDWEREFPLFELILKETMRFTMAGQIVRKNISNKGVPVGDTEFVIPQNSFAVYSVEDAHMNPSVYENPLEWDPSRHDKNRAKGSQSPHSFLAWGSRNHVCPAMRFSKLNILVPTVMLVALYGFEMCNAKGQTCNEPLPSLSFDGIGAGRPTGKVYVKCNPRVKEDA